MKVSKKKIKNTSLFILEIMDNFSHQVWFNEYSKKIHNEIRKELGPKVLDTNSRNGEKLSHSRWAFIHIYDFLKCVNDHANAELPVWATPELMKKLETLSLTSMFSIYGSKETCKLAVGRLIKETVDYMNTCIQGKSPHKLILCGTHDTTIVPFLSALDAWDGNW